MSIELRPVASRIPSRAAGTRWGAFALLVVGLSVGSALPARGTTIANVIYNSANGHYYKWVASSGTWGTAKSGASALGGYLASVTSASEQSFIVGSVAQSNTAFWIGGTDEQTEGTWTWVNGDSFGYTNWNSGEPNNSGNEDYLMMNTNGTWNDWNASGANPGYVVEWDTNPNIPPIPNDPTLLTAVLNASNHAILNWKDNSTTEASFQIERKAAQSPYSPLAGVAADTTTYDDGSVIPSTQYTYRLRAVNAGGNSNYTNEATVAVPGTPTGPVSPSDYAQSDATPTSITMQWTDNSNNEESFEIQRKNAAGAYEYLTNVVAGTQAYEDTGLAPDSSYSYRIRSVNINGSSSFDAAGGTTASTLGVATFSADLKDGTTFGKDSLKFTADFSFLEGASDGEVDPVAEGITVRGGPDGSPVSLTLPPLAEGWKVKNGKATWKSPSTSATKYKVVVDTVKLRVQVTITKLELGSAPVNPMRVSVAIGNDAGREVIDWPAQKKAGVFKFRQ